MGKQICPWVEGQGIPGGRLRIWIWHRQGQILAAQVARGMPCPYKSTRVCHGGAITDSLQVLYRQASPKGAIVVAQNPRDEGGVKMKFENRSDGGV